MEFFMVLYEVRVVIIAQLLRRMHFVYKLHPELYMQLVEIQVVDLSL